MKNDFFMLDNVTYLDSGSSSIKLKSVVDVMGNYYRDYGVNIDRGGYDVSLEASNLYEKARKTVASFLNCDDSSQIIFTSGATEASNLLAYSYGLDNLTSSDSVVLSIMEHHSTIVPWQYVSKRTGCSLKYMYLDDYTLNMDAITDDTKVVVISHVSNVLGLVNDISLVIKRAREVGAIVIVDASQSISHIGFDVKKYDVDFMFFSSHKMFGPNGVGVLYGKKELLDSMNPFMMGGGMVEYVYEDSCNYKFLPNKFEAGSRDVAGVLGLECAINYINNFGYTNISLHDFELVNYLVSKLKELDFIEIYGKSWTSIVSFNIKGVHAHDVGSILNSDNICIRVGNHCAQPLLRHLGLDSTCRVSFNIYNTKEDIDKLILSLKKVADIFYE